MRLARVQDHWRHVYTRTYPNKLESLSFARIVGIGDGEITFSGGVTAICGGNGAGKSTLLDAILHSLDPTRPVIPAISGVRFADARLTARLVINGQVAERVSVFDGGNITVSADAPALEIRFLDPASLASKLMTRFALTQDLQGILETYSPGVADEDQLAKLSYLVRKDYQFCETFEIEDYDGEAPLPYFRVKAGGIAYGSETMGLGELSLHLMYWHLHQLPEKSILLLEEPETYIAPQSQSALMDFVAEVSDRRAVWVILTTHSPGVVANIPTEHIRLLSRETERVTVISNPTPSQLRAVLGIPHGYRGMILVEDRAARIYLRALLGRFASDLAQSYELVDMGSVDGVVAALSSFPASGPWLKVLGVFDGDMRGKIGTVKRPCTFLPGEVAPEAGLRGIAKGNASRIAAKMSRNTHDVSVSLAQLEGADSHDWLEDFARSLGMTYEQTVEYLVAAWLEDEENAKSASQLISEIRGLLESP